jgi:uncharacterized protein YdaU (DUF1376 family)
LSLPYYKRYPRDLVEGTIGMPLELKGAYSLVLDLIYMQDGRLPDDARYISGLLGCTIKRWNGLRNELLARGKIYITGEFLANYRADKERETLAKFQQNQAEKGRASNKNKDIPETAVRPARVYSEPDTNTTTLLNGREADLYDALGIHADQRANGKFMVLSEPLNWLASGCDMDADILPTIRSLSAKTNKVTSWRFFDAAVFEARDRRVAPAPAIQPRASSPPQRGPGKRTFMDAYRDLEHERTASNFGNVVELPANGGRS